MNVLVDSNIIIYASKSAYSFLSPWIGAIVPAVSAISHLETLGYHRLAPPERRFLEEFFANAEVLPIDSDTISRAIQLRQIRKIGLADSIVAATALIHGMVLATRNTKDSSWIDDLEWIDPIADSSAG